MKHYHLTAVIWKEGKRYVSKCPELGVASYGATLEKAKAALEEAVELYMSNAKKLRLLDDVKPAISSEARYTTHSVSGLTLRKCNHKLLVCPARLASTFQALSSTPCLAATAGRKPS